MHTIDTLIIGAGQAGLALSRCLTDLGHDHVVLDRGRIGERWRSERWDSLRLLTPNWMTRLPGWSYDGDDPDGFLPSGELVATFERYARSFDAPVEDGVEVESVSRCLSGYCVTTDAGTWYADHVVLATGWCDSPAVPVLAEGLPVDIHQATTTSYKNPSSLPDGGVLIVGASASGVQLADELQGAGRDVVLAVGSHTRVPRRYRGMDIWWWLDHLGSLDRTVEEVRDLRYARHEPSFQLIGRDDGRSVDLAALQRRGVSLAGHLVAAGAGRVRFAPDLAVSVREAEDRLTTLLARIDAAVAAEGLDGEVLPAERLRPVDTSAPIEQLELRARGITSVLWATGFRRSYPWLHVPVLGDDGEIVHRRGVTPSPGLYTLGQRFQHRRRSNFIDGVGADAEFVARHLSRHPASGPALAH